MYGTLEERFWPKVAKRGRYDCWEWLASRNNNGYGMISVGGASGRPLQAHRVAYELVIGDIPDGLQLDHLCRNRGCVNPYHLEPVSCRENLLRGNGASGRNARKTHCVHGHPLTPDNVYTPPSGGRKCLTCNRDICKRYQAKKRAAQREMS